MCALKMEIFAVKNLIQKSWCPRKNCPPPPPNSASGLRHCIGGRTGGRMEGCYDEWVYGQVERINGWIGGWMGGWVGGYVDDWMGG